MGCGGRPLSEQIPKKLVKLTLSLDLDLDYGTKSGRLFFFLRTAYSDVFPIGS